MTGVQVYEGDGIARGIVDWVDRAAWTYRVGVSSIGFDTTKSVPDPTWTHLESEEETTRRLTMPPLGHSLLRGKGFDPISVSDVPAVLASARVRIKRAVRQGHEPNGFYVFQVNPTYHFLIQAAPTDPSP